jgi:hypothetical protein
LTSKAGGSHRVFHGKGGTATLVKDHKGTAPLSEKMFMRKMEGLVLAAEPNVI